MNEIEEEEEARSLNFAWTEAFLSAAAEKETHSQTQREEEKIQSVVAGRC